MSESPKVSIVLPAYNGSRYLKAAIESCLAQSYENIELIIVNDGSTDPAVEEIVLSFRDKRIEYLKHDSNKGLSGALNTGFSQSKGEYLSWTSDDNFYAPEAIGIMASYLNKNTQIDFVYAGYHFIDQDGKILHAVSPSGPQALDSDNCVGGCFLYRRKVCEAIGPYDTKAFLTEDYDYWLRVRDKFRMDTIHNNLYYFRLHQGNLSAKYTDEGIMFRQLLRVWRKHFSRSKSYYLAGRKAFMHKQDYLSSKYLLLSLLLNPFQVDAWRIFAKASKIIK